MRIEIVGARSIPDSREKPTIETTLRSGELEAKASVPSGKSTGAHEAKELRDEDGSVSTALSNVTGEIAEAISTREFASTKELDAFLIELDGTPDKSRLGANAILSVSISATRLFALQAGVPLWRYLADTYGTTPSAPRLFVNVMNGGAHAGFRLPIQEHIFMVGEATLTESFATAERGFAELGEMLKSETDDLQMGDEGGYSPAFADFDKPFELLTKLVEKHQNTAIAIDSAANELRNDHGGYTLIGKDYTSEELRKLYVDLVGKFPFHAVEDPFAETDSKSFTELTADIGKQVLVIGDDITVTNPKRIENAIEEKSMNAVLIKPNQIGSVSEAAEAVKKTHSAGWATVCSHRSGETDDTFIADFAYGMGAHGIKAGGLGQKVRREKYERLCSIEKEVTI
ncbi:MAG TPA: phosphopyruvate hydratase [Candidatus Kaiserbacteria bacterium]|nr:phosphopyruvate hydratase [Candidatus Kaiserbacteria bacterium]